MILPKQEEKIDELAIKFVKYTNRNVFLTGGAGTGKTTFLRNLKTLINRKYIVLAPTSIAAMNAEGNTIHSFFQLPVDLLHLIASKQFKPKSRSFTEEKRFVIRELEILVIDEVSMVRADVFDAIDITLRIVREQPDEPFGGVKLLLIGDLFQLPPVLQTDEKNQFELKYSTPYFFGAGITTDLDLLKIELTKVYRQTDEHFVKVLNAIRNGSCTEDEIKELNRYSPDVKSVPTETILLTTHNYKSRAINLDRLSRLTEPEICFEAAIAGDFPESLYPIESRLILKNGAPVIFIKNDVSAAKRFYNGEMGVVSFIDSKLIKVTKVSGEIVSIERMIWTNAKYRLNETANLLEQVVIGEFHQFPLQLAWAITIHKSQGLTFEKAIVDVEECFLPGQLYVALSRVRSLSGLSLSSNVNLSNMMFDLRVTTYLNSFRESESIEGLLNLEIIDYIHSKLIGMFSFQQIKNNNESVKNFDSDFLLDTNTREIVAKICNYADLFSIELTRVLAAVRTDDYGIACQRIQSAVTYFENELNIVLLLLKNLRIKNTRLNIPVTALENSILEKIAVLGKAGKIVIELTNTGKVDTVLCIIDDSINSVGRAINLNPSMTKKDKKSNGGQTSEILKMLMNDIKPLQISFNLQVAEPVIDQVIVKGILTGELSAEKYIDAESAKLIRKVIIDNQDKSVNFIRALLPASIPLKVIKFAMAELEHQKTINN